MKVSFNLLVLGTESASGNKLNELRSHCAMANVPLTALDQLRALPAADLAQQVILIAGSCSAESLKSIVHELADAGAVPILVVDALQALTSPSSSSQLTDALVHLAESRIQTTVLAQVKGLVTSSRLMLYRFAKADSTATILVVVGAGTASARVLTITRLHDPFQDQESFPGGFLNPHTESLPGCGAREGSEETSVSVPEAELQLLDVRSRPERDQRGHVVDHGYMWLVPAHLAASVEASVQAGDDAKAGSARFVSAMALLEAGSMAFDHYDLLLAAVRTGKVLPPARLLVRLLRAAESLCRKLSLFFERKDSVYGRFHR
jgi:ADP-ribose pyrophosphatase YjhB (NUDIX family)